MEETKENHCLFCGEKIPRGKRRKRLYCSHNCRVKHDYHRRLKANVKIPKAEYERLLRIEQEHNKNQEDTWKL